MSSEKNPGIGKGWGKLPGKGKSPAGWRCWQMARETGDWRLRRRGM